jgi:inosine-uridine nucleoside N-ribohydrolase
MGLTLLALAGMVAASVVAASPARLTKIILDTDIGDDVDDVYALALAATVPNVELVGVTTAFGETGKRAELAAKLLWVMGRTKVPVCAGREGDHGIGPQHRWASGFRSSAMRKEKAVAFLRRQIEAAPGEITIVPIGALTNIGDLLTTHPEVRSKIKRVVLMGGAAWVGYNNRAPASPEWNIRCDTRAARTVFESGVPIVMAGLDATTMMQLDEDRQKRMAAFGGRTTDAIASLRLLWGSPIPTLFDPVAVAYAAGYPFADERPVRIHVEDDGLTRVVDGAPNATALVNPRKDEFLEWFVEAMRAAP